MFFGNLIGSVYSRSSPNPNVVSANLPHSPKPYWLVKNPPTAKSEKTGTLGSKNTKAGGLSLPLVLALVCLAAAGNANKNSAATAKKVLLIRNSFRKIIVELLILIEIKNERL